MEMGFTAAPGKNESFGAGELLAKIREYADSASRAG
jgi:hypothetical protein